MEKVISKPVILFLFQDSVNMLAFLTCMEAAKTAHFYEPQTR